MKMLKNRKFETDWLTLLYIIYFMLARLVAPAAQDWSLDLVTYPMSIMLAAGGISAAIVGKWTLKVRQGNDDI